MIQFGHQIGTHPDNGRNYFATVRAMAQASETAGFDAVFYPDHFQFRQHPFLTRQALRLVARLRRSRPSTTLLNRLERIAGWLARRTDRNSSRTLPVLECFTMLGAIAAITERIQLGALVAGIPYRNPALLARVNVTLDVISNGRCIIGLGAGWYEEEFRAYGWPFPSARQRVDRLEEAVQIIDMMTRQRHATFSGRHYEIDDALSHPLPVQRPRPPILIGGSGERRTLRLVAQYADYCNIFGSPAVVKKKLQVLENHCAEVERPFAEITCSNYVGVLIARNGAELARKRRQHPPIIGYPIIGTPDQIVEQLQAYVTAGVQYIIINMPDAHLIDPIHLFADTVMPAFANRC